MASFVQVWVEHVGPRQGLKKTTSVTVISTHVNFTIITLCILTVLKLVQFPNVWTWHHWFRLPTAPKQLWEAGASSPTTTTKTNQTKNRQTVHLRHCFCHTINNCPTSAKNRSSNCDCSLTVPVFTASVQDEAGLATVILVDGRCQSKRQSHARALCFPHGTILVTITEHRMKVFWIAFSYDSDKNFPSKSPPLCVAGSAFESRSFHWMLSAIENRRQFVRGLPVIDLNLCRNNASNHIHALLDGSVGTPTESTAAAESLRRQMIGHWFYAYFSWRIVLSSFRAPSSIKHPQ